MQNRPRPGATILPTVTPRNWERAVIAATLLPLKGRRLILVNEEGNHHDWRAWTEPVTSAGTLVIWVVPDAQWWRHEFLAMRPTTLVRWPAEAIWVELED